MGTSEPYSAQSALAALGIDLQEAVEMDESLKRRGPRDTRVCLCGHGMAKHKVIAGRIICKPSAMYCKCTKPRAVLDVEDTRFFLRSTQGGGSMHALSRGLSALALAGKNATWIIEMKCDRCGAVDEVLTPVPVSMEGRVRTEDTGLHGLLCHTCRGEG